MWFKEGPDDSPFIKNSQTEPPVTLKNGAAWLQVFNSSAKTGFGKGAICVSLLELLMISEGFSFFFFLMNG